MTRLLSIQYLRAVAVLMVVGFHLCVFSWRVGFEIGAAGVDVFFIISGFILWTIAVERPLSPASFLARRFARVAPLYWLATLAVAALGAKWPDLTFDGGSTPRHLALSLAFIHHLNQIGLPVPVLPVGWTLNDEVLFYLIFSASLFAPLKWRFRALCCGIAAVIVVGVAIPKLYFAGYNAMFLQFIAGAWLARLRLENRLPSRRWGWVMVGWAVIAFACLQPLNLYQTVSRPITWGLPALALVAGLVTVEANGPLPRIKWLLFLGDASYSIYLVHWPVMSAVSFAVRKGRLEYLPLAAIASLLVGAAVHLWLERPLLRLFRERLGGKRI